MYNPCNRLKREFHKSGSSHETGLQHDLCATSGSSSWDVDNKSCNSDNGETLMRYCRLLTYVWLLLIFTKCILFIFIFIVSASRTDMANKYYNSSGRSVTRPKKGDKLRRHKIECGDGAKYMSYIKVLILF